MRCGPAADRPRAARRRWRCALAALLVATTAAAAGGPRVVGEFSALPPGTALPPGWAPLVFRNVARHTAYTLEADADSGTVVHARAVASASGLIHRLDVDTAATPLLRWRWKVAAPVADGDVTRRDRDDYAARIYVTFRYTPERLTLFERARFAAARALYGEYPPHAGLNYIFDARSAVGTVIPNPYTERVRMIVVESGTTRAGRWLDYERDIVADYRRAFNEDPPPLSGIALMTDTDNTGASAEAWYGDLELRARP